MGVVGAGQLGWMLGLAAESLGIEVRYLDPSPDAPGGHVAPLIVAPFDDGVALRALADGADVVTYEVETVPVAPLLALQAASRVPVRPVPAALEDAQDRLREKLRFHEADMATADFEPAGTLADLHAAVRRLGPDVVVKARRAAFDGRGQRFVRSPADVEKAWRAFGSRPVLVERLVPFARELSIVAVRGLHGDNRFYPVVENVHREGILRCTLAPAPDLDAAIQARAEEYATALLDVYSYVGVLAIELFDTGGPGGLLANEFAPRVHNSGHWTIEGAATSQFENHLRAICGLPLGASHALGAAAMVNVIGAWRPVPEGPHFHLHDYRKAPRPRRKIGHVTVTAGTPAERDRLLASLSDV